VDTVAYQPAHLAEFIGRSASSALTPALIRPGIYVIWPEHEKPGVDPGARKRQRRLLRANLSGGGTGVKIARYRASGLRARARGLLPTDINVRPVVIASVSEIFRGAAREEIYLLGRNDKEKKPPPARCGAIDCS